MVPFVATVLTDPSESSSNGFVNAFVHVLPSVDVHIFNEVLLVDPTATQFTPLVAIAYTCPSLSPMGSTVSSYSVHCQLSYPVGEYARAYPL